MKTEQTITPEARRRRMLERMEPALRGVAAELEKKERGIARGTLTFSWDIGRRIADVRDSEATYGSRAIEQLAEYLDKSLTTVYGLLKIATTYKRNEVDDLASRQFAKGGYLTVGHLFLLALLKIDEHRQHMQERVFAESLTVETLRREIRRGSGRGESDAGRKPAAPVSLIAGAEQIVANAKTSVKRVDIWRTHIFDIIDDLSAQKITDELRVNLVAARDALVAERDAKTSAIERLDANIDRADRVLALRASKKAEKPARKRRRGHDAEPESDSEADAEAAAAVDEQPHENVAEEDDAAAEASTDVEADGEQCAGPEEDGNAETEGANDDVETNGSEADEQPVDPEEVVDEEAPVEAEPANDDFEVDEAEVDEPQAEAGESANEPRKASRRGVVAKARPARRRK